MRRALLTPISLTNRIWAGRPKDRNCRWVAILRHLRGRPAIRWGRPPSGHPDTPPAVTPAAPAGGPVRAGVDDDIVSPRARAAPPVLRGRVFSPTSPLLGRMACR